MKRMLLALLILTVTVVPTFAADQPAPAEGDMPHMMHRHTGMMPQMMQNPQHMLAMAYHKNLVSFGKVLEMAAQKGETVPRDVARAAVTEMRRSADQMEIYHEQAARSLPEDQKAKHAEMAKMMETHLVQMKSQLAQLDDYTKGDRIDSRELLKRLEPLLKGCREMCGKEGCGGGMHHGKGMRGGMPCGMKGGCQHGGMQGCCGHGCGGMKGGQQGGCMKGGCEQGCCGHGGMHGGMHGRMMHRGGPQGWSEMMQQRQKMMAAMKAQDAELTRLVDAMNRAPKDQKQALMADLLTRMVQQRVDMVQQMEQLQEQMRHHMGAMQGMQGDADDGAYDDGSGDMDSDDMDSDDGASDDADMDMKGMKM